MPHLPLLSICIPSYKKADWLEASLEITLAQASELEDGLIEVIVSDDASPDNSHDVLEKLQKKHPKLLFPYYQKTNLGNNANYIFTLNQARGTFAWLLGNDDFLRPNALVKIVEILKSNSEINFFYISYTYFKPPSNPALVKNILEQPIQESDYSPSIYGQHSIKDKHLKWLGEIPALDFECLTPMYAAIVRKELWKEAFGYASKAEPFHDLDGIFGYAQYIIENAFHQSGYYVGYPYVLASSDISWSKVAASVCIRNWPKLYDLLEREGVEKSTLRQIRKFYLKRIRTSLPYVLMQPNIFYHNEFSFKNHTYRFWSYPQYWYNLLYLIYKLSDFNEAKGFWVNFFKKLLPASLWQTLKKIKFNNL